VLSNLRYLGHSTVLLDIDGVRILTDPLLVDRLGLLHRHSDAVAHLIEDVDIDVVLVSHAHHDHLHLPSLRRCRGKPRIVVPKGLGSIASRTGHDVTEVAAGERFEVGGVAIEVVRADHDGRRRPFGPTADAIGYVIAGSSRVYFAGDTDLFAEMADLAGTVDVALLPVWGWGPRLGAGHLDPARAAEAPRRLRGSDRASRSPSTGARSTRSRSLASGRIRSAIRRGSSLAKRHASHQRRRCGSSPPARRWR